MAGSALQWRGPQLSPGSRSPYGRGPHGPGPSGLQHAYELCRMIHRDRGRSYYRATALLPAARRRAVHALYAYTRIADDIVDAGSHEGAAQRLATWRMGLLGAVAGEPSADPVLPAVADAVRSYGLDLAQLDLFLHSMAMDLTITRYRTYDDLLGYMEGSSAVIGTLMLPILGLARGADPALAQRCARELGYAFQLTNFIRDVAEDLARGRVYLPQEDLARFDVTWDTLAADAERGRGGPQVRELIRFECGRALRHYQAALPGISLLQPRSRACIRAAFLLYAAILGEVRRAGYDVMAGRAVVPGLRRAHLVAGALIGRTPAVEVRRWGNAGTVG